MANYCYPPGAIWVKPPAPAAVDPDAPTADEAAATAAWQATIDDAEALAWLTLRTLTAGALATCPVLVRPCRSRCRNGDYYVAGYSRGTPFYPLLLDGQWINIWCGHRDQCSCTEVQEVVLPGPVGEVISVTLDGNVLPKSAYRVDNGNRLVRTDGGSWPYCQDMNANSGEGTFLVEYLQGGAPTQLENRAAGALAAEWEKAFRDDKKCALPRGAKEVSRQGVTYDVITDLFGTGITGIASVDIVVRSWNPNGLRQRPRVWSPDVQRGRRPTAGRY